MPVSFSALELSFLGTDQEELAIIPFCYRPGCNVQSTGRGCGVCLLCKHFATYTPTACFLFQEVLRKGFTFQDMRSICSYSPSQPFFGMSRSVSANLLMGERCATSQKTAARETSIFRARNEKPYPVADQDE